MQKLTPKDRENVRNIFLIKAAKKRSACGPLESF